MAGEGIAAQQMLQQQAALEQRNAGMQNMMKQQAASQIMRQIAMGEVQRSMAREAQTGRALGSAADRESRRDVGKARLETQRELEEKQRLLGLIGGAAEAAGALGAYMISQQALEDAQFQGRMEKAALDPEVDDFSQFNPEDIAALQAMAERQAASEAAFKYSSKSPLMFDEEKLKKDFEEAEAEFDVRPEVDDFSQFNPEDLAALEAMSQEQTLADAAPLMFDEEKLKKDLEEAEAREHEKFRRGYRPDVGDFVTPGVFHDIV